MKDSRTYPIVYEDTHVGPVEYDVKMLEVFTVDSLEVRHLPTDELHHLFGTLQNVAGSFVVDAQSLHDEVIAVSGLVIYAYQMRHTVNPLNLESYRSPPGKMRANRSGRPNSMDTASYET